MPEDKPNTPSPDDTTIDPEEISPSPADEALYRLAMDNLRRSIDTVENTNMLTTLRLMAGLCIRLGKYDEAGVYLLEALEADRRMLGEDDFTTLIFNNSMGSLNHMQGKYYDAEVYYTQALEGFRRVIDGKYGFGKPHRVLVRAMPYSIWTINSLIKLYDDWDKPEEAKKYRDMLPEEDAVTKDTNE